MSYIKGFPFKTPTKKGEVGIDPFKNILTQMASGRIYHQFKADANVSAYKPGGNAGSFSTTGLFSTNVLTQGTTSVVAATSLGYTARFTLTVAIAGGLAGLYQNNNLLIRGDQAYMGSQKFQLDQITDIRFFSGLVDTLGTTTMTASDNPSNAYCGIQYCNGTGTRGDTHLQMVVRPTSGGTQVLVDTGQTPDVTKKYEVEYIHDGVGTLIMNLWDNLDTLLFTNTFTGATNIVGITVPLCSRMVVEGLGGAANSWQFWKGKYFNQRNS